MERILRYAPDRLEAAVVSRLMWRLMPFLFLLYIVAYLDRINVGFGILQMRGQLGLTDRVYGRAAGMFFAGYFFFQLPSNLLLEKFGVDHRHHDPLGCDLVPDDFHPGSGELLQHALSAGSGGGGILSRNHSVHETLVSSQGASPGGGLVYDCESSGGSSWQSGIGRLVGSAWARSQRVAMDVHHRGLAGDCARSGGVFHLVGLAGGSTLAESRASGVAVANVGSRACTRSSSAPK